MLNLVGGNLVKPERAGIACRRNRSRLSNIGVFTMSTESNSSTTTSADTSVLRLLLEVGRYFNSSLDFPEVVKMVMDKVIEVLKAERGCLFLLNESGEPKMITARGLDRTVIEAEDFSFSRTLVT